MQKGFSLVEMVLVMAISAVIYSAMIIPAMGLYDEAKSGNLEIQKNQTEMNKILESIK